MDEDPVISDASLLVLLTISRHAKNLEHTCTSSPLVKTETCPPVVRMSAGELIVAIASEVIGVTIFAWLIGNLVNLVLNLDPAERNRKSMMNYLGEYLREVPLGSKAKNTIARNYAFHLQVSC